MGSFNNRKPLEMGTKQLILCDINPKNIAQSTLLQSEYFKLDKSGRPT